MEVWRRGEFCSVCFALGNAVTCWQETEKSEFCGKKQLPHPRGEKRPQKTSELKPNLENEAFLGKKDPHWAESCTGIPKDTKLPLSFPPIHLLSSNASFVSSSSLSLHPSSNESLPVPFPPPATSISMDNLLLFNNFPPSTWPEEIRSSPWAGASHTCLTSSISIFQCTGST